MDERGHADESPAMDVQYGRRLILPTLFEVWVDRWNYISHRTQGVEKHSRVGLGLHIFSLRLNLVFSASLVPTVDSMLSVDTASDFGLVRGLSEELVAVLGDVVDDELVGEGLLSVLWCEVF